MSYDVIRIDGAYATATDIKAIRSGLRCGFESFRTSRMFYKVTEKAGDILTVERRSKHTEWEGVREKVYTFAVKVQEVANAPHN